VILNVKDFAINVVLILIKAYAHVNQSYLTLPGKNLEIYGMKKENSLELNFNN